VFRVHSNFTSKVGWSLGGHWDSATGLPVSPACSASYAKPSTLYLFVPSPTSQFSHLSTCFSISVRRRNARTRPNTLFCKSNHSQYAASDLHDLWRRHARFSISLVSGSFNILSRHRSFQSDTSTLYLTLSIFPKKSASSATPHSIVFRLLSHAPMF
jgi:hypothetical protein